MDKKNKYEQPTLEILKINIENGFEQSKTTENDSYIGFPEE